MLPDYPTVSFQVHSTVRQPGKERRREEEGGEGEERGEEEEVERAQTGGGGEGQSRERVHRDVHQLTKGQR